MNNYPEFRNYTDSFINNIFDNNMESMNTYNKMDKFSSDSSNQLYDSYNGLIRGNLFKNLYVPYKREEPYQIKPMNEQANMLTNLDGLCFSMIDLNLYLDINPNDKDILKLFNEYRMKYNKLLEEYESRFGPITINSDSLNSYPWSWDDMPWPWDN